MRSYGVDCKKWLQKSEVSHEAHDLLHCWRADSMQRRFGFGLCLVALLGLGSSQNEPTDLDDLTVNFRIAPGCEKKLYRRDPKTTTLSVEEQNQCQAIFDCGPRCQGAESQCNEQTLPICNTYRRRECKTTYEKTYEPSQLETKTSNKSLFDQLETKPLPKQTSSCKHNNHLETKPLPKQTSSCKHNNHLETKPLPKQTSPCKHNNHLETKPLPKQTSSCKHNNHLETKPFF
eukprot:TCALIF_09245-PA protein Name:"Protein of unknown function" AED:0.52 eAED:0.52 QI:0/0/0/0.5/1/1/4/0/231